MAPNGTNDDGEPPANTDLQSGATPSIRPLAEDVQSVVVTTGNVGFPYEWLAAYYHSQGERQATRHAALTKDNCYLSSAVHEHLGTSDCTPGPVGSVRHHVGDRADLTRTNLTLRDG